MLYLSNANYKQHNYRTACNQLEAVVLQRKSMLRFKSSYLTAIESSYPQFQDAELRYKIAICYQELGEYNMAMSTLQAVKTRTPRLNMLLARLMHHHGRGVSKKEIALAFKDVLRECPMSLTSIEALIELGIDGSEVHSMVVNGAYFPKDLLQLNQLRVGWGGIVKGYCPLLEGKKPQKESIDSNSRKSFRIIYLIVNRTKKIVLLVQPLNQFLG